MGQPPRIGKIKVRIFPGRPPQLSEGDLALGDSTIAAASGVSLFVGTKSRKNIEILDKSDSDIIYPSLSGQANKYNATENTITFADPSIVLPTAVTIMGRDPGEEKTTEIRDRYGSSALLLYGTMIIYGDDGDSLSALSITTNTLRAHQQITTISLSSYAFSATNRAVISGPTFAQSLTATTITASNNIFIGQSGQHNVDDLFTVTANLSGAIPAQIAASAAANATATGNILNGTAVFSGTNTFNGSISAQTISAFSDAFIINKSIGNLFTATGNIVTAFEASTGNLKAVQDSLVVATGNNKSLIETTTGNIVTTFEASTGNLKAVQDSLVTATGDILDGTAVFSGTNVFNGTISANTISAIDYFVKSITAENITTTGEKLALKGSLTITGDTVAPEEIYALKVISPGHSNSATEPAFIVLTGGNVGVGVRLSEDRGTAEESFGARFTINGTLSAGSITAQAVSASTISGTLANIEAFEEDANGDLMPLEGLVLNNHIWALNSNDDLHLRANYFSYPDWEIFAIANSTTTEQLESVVFG